ncbi:porphobilinogen deaminase [Pichia californica]|nr:porphobilinogen deaminase [[Candida] californica]
MSHIVQIPKVFDHNKFSNVPKVEFQNETVRIGSRKSLLAVCQSEIVGNTIKKFYPFLNTTITKVSTLGDQIQNRPLYSFGGKALWTKELEILLLQDVGDFQKIDLIAHSLKDMPTILPDDFELDPRDALVMKQGSSYKSLSDLPAGSIVGTSSVRRSAQISRNYPHLIFKSVRGNIHTRLNKLDDKDSDYSCIILAAAGLIRCNFQDRITKYLNCDEMYHAVGQGAIGVEIQKNNEKMRLLCSVIGCRETTWKCVAERSLLRTLEGGCSVPVGVWTTYDELKNILKLKAIVLSVDGKESVEDSHEKEMNCDKDALDLGIELAEKLIAKGAKKILDEINFNKIQEIKEAGLTN